MRKVRIKSWTPTNKNRGLDWQWGRPYIGTHKVFTVIPGRSGKILVSLLCDDYPLDRMAMACDVVDVIDNWGFVFGGRLLTMSNDQGALKDDEFDTEKEDDGDDIPNTD